MANDLRAAYSIVVGICAYLVVSVVSCVGSCGCYGADVVFVLVRVLSDLLENRKEGDK